MTTFDQTHLERQLSSLFRAEAQDAHLPLGTWQEIAPKMGAPDRRSLFGLIRDAVRIPLAEKMWRNPMRVRYVAPAATVVLAIIIALLFILLVNDTDDDGPTPAVSPTVPVGTPTLVPTFTPLPATATPEVQVTPTASETTEPSDTSPPTLVEGEWVKAADPPFVVYDHRTILLDDGRLMVAGGRTDSEAFLNLYFYDFESNTWSEGPVLSEPRRNPAVAKLQDGRVLITGGSGEFGRGTSSAEMYDPSTDAIEAVSPMNEPRRQHEIVLLNDGRVLVVGGLAANNEPTLGAEVYDASSNAWVVTTEHPSSLTPTVAGEKNPNSIGLLSDGRVITLDRTGTVWTWVPGSSEWMSDYDELDNERILTIASLPDGTTVLSSDEAIHVLMPGESVWTEIPSIQSADIGIESIDTLDGRVVIPPWLNSDDSLRIVDPVSGGITTAPHFDPDVGNGHTVAIRPGVIMHVGGRLNAIQYETSAYILLLPD